MKAQQKFRAFNCLFCGRPLPEHFRYISGGQRRKHQFCPGGLCEQRWHRRTDRCSKVIHGRSGRVR